MPAADPDLALQLARTVADIYGDAAARMLAAVARRLANGIDQPGWAERKLAEIVQLRNDANQIVGTLERVGTRAIYDAIAEAYNTGSRDAAVELGVTFGRTNQRAVDALAQATIGQVTATHSQILRSANDIYRTVVAETAAPPVLTGTATRRQAAQAALDRWRNIGLTGFRDRAGRNWALETYAEMATRTAAGRAQVDGHLDRYVADGRDLVIVSNAPQECSKCRPWEGKVLSISGATPGYPTVAEARSDGLQHANCRHNLGAYIEGLTRPMTHTADPEGDRARQEQRRLERGVRQWKTAEALAITPDAQRQAKAKVREWQAKLREHVEANDLKRLRYREQVGAGR